MKRKVEIGRLEEVPIREVFPHEAHDFTVWLADNLSALSEALGFNLFFEKRELTLENVRADIVCRDDSGEAVVIENQLETSDDDHFARIIQYMGKLEAKKAIWITPEPHQRHLDNIRTLNTQSKPGYEYYLVKVRAIRIDNSRPYPLFEVVLRPENQAVVAQEIVNRQEIEENELSEPPKSSRKSPVVWCFYPRRDEATYNLFLRDKCVGLGFGNELGDLRKIEATPESFKNLWMEKHPDSSGASARSFYAMFYSFVHRVKIGHLVVYAPTWRERAVYIGKIAGPYEYSRKLFSAYSHRRAVEWINEFPRDIFSPEALKGIAVTLAIFQARNERFLQELSERLSG
jgi:hypothetical protein